MRSQPSPLMLHLLCQIGTSQSCCCCVRVSSRRSVHLFHFFFIAPVGQKPEIFSLSENAPATQHSSKRPGASSYAFKIIAAQGAFPRIITVTTWRNETGEKRNIVHGTYPLHPDGARAHTYISYKTKAGVGAFSPHTCVYSSNDTNTALR